jgi:hypothetical protein
MLSKMRSAFLLFGLLLVTVKGINAQTLQTGCGYLNTNGNIGELCIDQINGATGAFRGYLAYRHPVSVTMPVHGLWDESSKRIAFR